MADSEPIGLSLLPSSVTDEINYNKTPIDNVKEKVKKGVVKIDNFDDNTFENCIKNIQELLDLNKDYSYIKNDQQTQINKIYYTTLNGNKITNNFKILQTDNIDKIITFVDGGTFGTRLTEITITEGMTTDDIIQIWKENVQKLNKLKHQKSINTDNLKDVLLMFAQLYFYDIKIYNIFSQHILSKTISEPEPAPANTPANTPPVQPVPPVPGSSNTSSSNTSSSSKTTSLNIQASSSNTTTTTTTTTTTQEKSAGFFEVYADDQGNLQVKNIVLHMGTELYSYAIDKNSEQKDDIRSDLAGKFLEQLNPLHKP